MAIAKMKKIKGFAMQSDRDALLRELQLTGCLEVTEMDDEPDAREWLEGSKDTETKLSEFRNILHSVDSAIKALDKYAHVKSGMFKSRSETRLSSFFDEKLPEKAMSYVSSIQEAEKELLRLYAEESKKEASKAFLELWLGLDIPLDTEDTQYAGVYFGTIPSGSDFDTFCKELRVASDRVEAICAGSDREQTGVLVIFYKEHIEQINAVLRKFGFNRVFFRDYAGTARENYDKISSELALIREEINKSLERLRELGSGRDIVKLYYDRISQQMAIEETKEKLINTDKAFAFKGWVPADKVPAVKKVFDRFGCAYELTDPEKGDNVPIKLVNNPLTAPLSMVTEMYSLPSYDGVDPNPLMMPFFTIFFGIMFNDIGYGLVLILISLIVKAKVKLRGTMKYMMGLMTLCGITTALVGFLTGSFFGDAIPTIAGLYGKQISLPYLFSPLEDPLMVLIGALIIGFIQIITGMAIKAYMLIRDGHFLDALFDVGSWWLLFAGIGVLAAGGTYWVALAGVAALILTQGRSKPTLIGKIIGGIASLYDITSYFGDILSYSRLMALMLAGGVVATVVNMLGALPGNIIFYLIIFLIGHVFNMGLNIVGTYVHASRLQYLEYFGKFYRDGGKPFTPLSIKTKYVDIIKEEN